MDYYENLTVAHDETLGIDWIRMAPSPVPVITIGMLQDLDTLLYKYIDSQNPPKFLVMASNIEGVFNLGGHLDYFHECVLNKDKNALSKYAHACVKLVYEKSTGLRHNIFHITLIQGTAFGGGFEAALSADVIVAEENATFSFPESIFGMFPGMGALTMLRRRVSISHARKIITVPDVYTAQDLFNMGIVDVVVPVGQGENAVRDVCKKYNRYLSAHAAANHICNNIQTRHSILLDELRSVTNYWVNQAMHLNPQQLKRMKTLAKAQSRKTWTNLHKVDV